MRIKKWGLDKNHKETEMRAILHQKRQRDALGKASSFSVRGRPLKTADVLKYFRRKGVRDPEAEVASVGVIPEAVRCWTPSPGQEPHLVDMDANSDIVSPWPVKFPHPREFQMAGFVPPKPESQSSQPITNHQMHPLPSLSPQLRILELPRSPSPPRTFIISERLLFDIKAYFEGSFRNGTFASNDKGLLVRISGTPEAGYRLQRFSYLCATAGTIMAGGEYFESRRLLSMASSLVRDIVLEQQPRTLYFIFKAVLYFSFYDFHDIAVHLLRYIGEMATHLLQATDPWRQILFQMGTVQVSDLQPLLGRAWSCTTNTFQNLFGPFHPDSLFCGISFAQSQFEPNTAIRVLRLLEEAEENLAGSDMRVMYLRKNYGLCLLRLGRYTEAIPVAQKIPTSSSMYIEALDLLAHCHYNTGHMREAEMNILECIEFNRRTYGKAYTGILSYMHTLRLWLHEWERAEEAKGLEVEMRQLTEGEGIDEI